MADLSAWTPIEEFNVEQAACLWSGVHPPAFVGILPTHGIAAALQLLSSAVSDGRLPAKHDYNPYYQSGDFRRSLVTRPNLKVLAESVGARPRFLFPPAPWPDAEARERMKQVAEALRAPRGPGYIPGVTPLLDALDAQRDAEEQVSTRPTTMRLRVQPSRMLEELRSAWPKETPSKGRAVEHLQRTLRVDRPSARKAADQFIKERTGALPAAGRPKSAAAKSA